MYIPALLPNSLIFAGVFGLAGPLWLLVTVLCFTVVFFSLTTVLEEVSRLPPVGKYMVKPFEIKIKLCSKEKT